MRKIILEHPAIIHDAHHGIGAIVEVADDYPVPTRTVVVDGEPQQVPLAREFDAPAALNADGTGMTDAEAGQAEAGVDAVSGQQYEYADEEADDEAEDVEDAVSGTKKKKKGKH